MSTSDAAGSTGGTPRAGASRPGPILWLQYCFGKVLPESMHGWVLRDLTGPRAVPRHLVRGMVPFLPIFILLALLPGEWWIGGASALLAIILALFYCLAYMHPNRERRLLAHGLPGLTDTESEIRAQAERRTEYESKYRGPADRPQG